MKKEIQSDLDVLIKDILGTRWSIPYYILDYIVSITKEIDSVKGSEIEGYIKSKLKED